MSTVETTNLKNPSSATNNIVLNSDGSVGGDLATTLASKPAATYGTTEPTSPATGDIWYDSNSSPAEAKYYDGSVWQVFSTGAGAAAISSPAATGQYTDGGITYDYYTFTASGTLTVTQEGLADILLVGGGGSGGMGGLTTQGGGGGGGGQVLEIFGGFLPAGSIAVTVGSGGNANGNYYAGENGYPTVLGPYIALGGGGGGSVGNGSSHRGRNGANGGGTAATSSIPGSAWLTSGFAGGGGSGNGGGGGGGASAVGLNTGSRVGGNGGAGAASSMSGSSVTYGGGGGGGCADGPWTAGTGGSGGGGNGGGYSSPGAAGTANTGGGGGGGGNGEGGGGYHSGGFGGSGIVIVRVAV